MTHTKNLDLVQVYRTYKFLLRPTSRQSRLLGECLEDMRVLYNAALEERREAWRMGKHKVTFYSQDAQLKDIRSADPERYGRWAYHCERRTLKRLDEAFQGFFRRVKAGKTPGYPRFKSRTRFDSVTCTEDSGSRWDSGAVGQATHVFLKGVGHIRVHQHRAVKGTVRTLSFKRERERWYVFLACADVPAEPLPATGAVVGIDLGIASFLTTSDGRQVANHRHLSISADRLAAAQRDLSRKKRGSRRRRKAVRRVAGISDKVGRQRLDFAHKTALAMARDHDLIVHEALQVANMTRRPKPRPADDGSYEPNGAAAKAGLNRSIHDAGWGIFLKVLRDKAESAGRVVIEVNPRHTSQKCAPCGHVDAGNRTSQAVFRCLACNHEAHADINAAINILRAGLALQAAQAA